MARGGPASRYMFPLLEPHARKRVASDAHMSAGPKLEESPDKEAAKVLVQVQVRTESAARQISEYEIKVVCLAYVERFRMRIRLEVGEFKGRNTPVIGPLRFGKGTSKVVAVTCMSFVSQVSM
jgi:hypothetical protein